MRNAHHIIIGTRQAAVILGEPNGVYVIEIGRKLLPPSDSGTGRDYVVGRIWRVFLTGREVTYVNIRVPLKAEGTKDEMSEILRDVFLYHRGANQ